MMAIMYRAFLILYGIVLGALFVGATSFFIDHWGKDLKPGVSASAGGPVGSATQSTDAGTPASGQQASSTRLEVQQLLQIRQEIADLRQDLARRQGDAADVGPRQSTPASNELKLRNAAVVPVTKVLPADADKATAGDGSSFFTAHFWPQRSGAPVRVRVTAYASAIDPNVAVLAVFLTGREAPIGLVSKPVSNNNRELIELVADIPAPGTNPLTFDFRIGPGTPGTIIFNGPEGASVPAATVITITE